MRQVRKGKWWWGLWEGKKKQPANRTSQEMKQNKTKQQKENSAR